MYVYIYIYMHIHICICTYVYVLLCSEEWPPHARLDTSTSSGKVPFRMHLCGGLDCGAARLQSSYIYIYTVVFN